MSKIDKLIQELCPDGVKFKRLDEVATTTIGEFVHKNKQNPDAAYPVYNGGRTETGYYDQYNNQGEKIIISARGAYAGFVNCTTKPYWAGNSSYSISVKSPVNTDWRYIYYFLKRSQDKFTESQQKGGIPAVSKKQVEKFKIPVPPLEVQAEIVKILDTFTQLEAELEAELEARRKQYEFYRNQLLTFTSDRIFGNSKIDQLIQELCPDGVKFNELGELLNYEQPGKYIVKSTEYDPGFSTPVLTAGQSFILGYTNETNRVYAASKDNPVMIFDDFTTSNHWVDFPFKVKSSAMKLLTPKPDQEINFRYVSFAIKCIAYQPSDHARHWISKYSKFKIPVPPIEVQAEVVAILDKFDKLVNDISEGLPAELNARHKQYEYYRTKLLTFQEAKE